MVIRRLIAMLVLLAGAGVACAADQDEPASELPAPVQAIQEQGVQIVGQFEVPGDMTGYAGVAGQRSIAIYLTADKKHAIIGYMINGDGDFVDRETVQQMTVGPMSKRIWSQLENSTWVVTGAADAPRTVYVFSDPNCPYCHLFWQRARPWVEAGKVQLRHVLVGIIGKTSPNKAATILTADNPEEAFVTNERQFADGGIEPMEDIPAEIQSQLIANLQLMRQLGVRGTPGVAYKDSNGHVQIWRGVPPEQAITKVLGPAPE